MFENITFSKEAKGGNVKNHSRFTIDVG